MRERDPLSALSLVLRGVDAVRSAHRLLLALGIIFAVLALFWLIRLSVSGALVGPLLFGLSVPFGVLEVGQTAVSLVAVVVPLAAPAVWSGAGEGQVVTGLARLIPHRLLTVLLPGLIYLRGTCAVYLALTDDTPAQA